MNGPGGTNPPEPGDHGGSTPHTMPDIPAPQQPSMGPPPRRAGPSVTTNATPPGRKPATGRNHHGNANDAESDLSSPNKQVFSQINYAGPVFASQTSPHTASHGRNNDAFLMERHAFQSGTPQTTNTYQIHPGAQAIFQNSFANRGHQQYQIPQMPVTRADQPNVQPYYSNFAQMFSDKGEVHFAYAADHMSAMPSDYNSKPNVPTGELLPPSVVMNLDIDDPFGLDTKDGEDLASTVFNFGKSSDDQAAMDDIGTSAGFVNEFQEKVKEWQTGNTNSAIHKPTGDVGIATGMANDIQIIAEESRLGDANSPTYVAAGTAKRRKTEHTPTPFQIPTYPAEKHQMTKQALVSRDASINMQPVQQQVSRSQQRKQSGEEQAAAGAASFVLNDTDAKGFTIERALANSTTLIELEVQHADDDLERVRLEPLVWINAIMKAFRKPYGKSPAFHDFGDIDAKFAGWQAGEWKHAKAAVTGHWNPDLLESCATVLFHKTVQSHERRALKKSSGASFRLDPTLRCSRRLLVIIAAIEHSALVKRDFVTNQRIDELIGGPMHLIKSKEANKVTNERKGEFKHLVKKEAGTEGKPPRAKKTADSYTDQLLGLSEVAFEVSGYLASSWLPSISSGDGLSLSSEIEDVGEMGRHVTQILASTHGFAGATVEKQEKDDSSEEVALPE